MSHRTFRQSFAARGLVLALAVSGLALVVPADAQAGTGSAVAYGASANPQSAPSRRVPTFSLGCDSVKSRTVEFAAAGVENVLCQRGGALPASGSSVNSTICEQLQQGTWWSNDRFRTCMIWRLRMDYINANTGAIIGSAFIKVDNDVSMVAVGDRRWWNSLSLEVESATTGWPATVLVLGTDCWTTTINNCTVGYRDGSYASQPIPWGVGKSATGNLRTDNVGSTTIDTMWVDYTAVVIPQVPNSTPGNFTWSSADVRCDNVRGNRVPGCIVPWYWPTMDRYFQTDPNHYQVAQHIANSMSVTVNHWGWNGRGLPLTFTSDESLKRANHDTACRNFIPSPSIPGDSCDEYPFESTYEGASRNSDFTIAHVSSTQNSSAGGTLVNWYADNHILDGDKFWMYVRV